MPIGPPGQRPPSGPLQHRQQGSQAPKELPVNDRAQDATVIRSPTPVSTVSPAPGLAPPNDSKPSVSEALAPISAAPAPPLAVTVGSTAKAPPSGPKSSRVVPALPMMVNNKSSAPVIASTTDGPLATAAGNAPQHTGPKAAPPTQIAMEEANRQARAAVANAMAKMNTNVQTTTAQPKPVTGGNAVETLTKKVGEMRTSDSPRGSGRGGMRGPRGNFRGGQNQGRKIEVPKSDYDFESANAKFNKEDMIKEAIATGSPIGGPSEDGVINGSTEAAINGDKRKDSLPPSTTEAYNKSSSFFDNISSEAKDREDGANQQMGRGRRGEEIKKNLETFGQGSVDGGFRGRGRGGFRGRGRPYGAQRGYGNYGRGGGQRGRGHGGPEYAQA
jgi:protein LSM14